MMNDRLKGPNIFDWTESYPPTVISVLSGKGGTGKSVIAFNLAAIAAREGYKSLVIDCDWYFGNIHILANVIPELTLADIIHDENLSSKAVIHLNERLHMIASSAAGRSETEYNTAILTRFLKGIRTFFSEYEFVIIDTPSGVVDIITMVSNASDLNLIVINPELTSIAAGYSLFKHLVISNKKIEAHLFVNRVLSGTDYEYIYQKFALLGERFLRKMPLGGGYLLDDKHLIDSVARQEPLVEFAPDSLSTEQFLKLCNFITTERIRLRKVIKTKSRRIINSRMTTADIGK